MYSNRGQRGTHAVETYLGGEAVVDHVLVKECRLMWLFFRRVPALLQGSVCNASCTETKRMALHGNGCKDFSFLPAKLCLVFLLK